MVSIRSVLLGFVLPFAFATGTCACNESAGSIRCTTQPQSKWLQKEAMSERIAEAGYKTVVIQDVRGSCVHVRALTLSKRQADVYFDPVTGDVVSAVLFDE